MKQTKNLPAVFKYVVMPAIGAGMVCNANAAVISGGSGVSGGGGYFTLWSYTYSTNPSGDAAIYGTFGVAGVIENFFGWDQSNFNVQEPINSNPADFSYNHACAFTPWHIETDHLRGGNYFAYSEMGTNGSC